jgi:hypothetical protein
VIPDSGMRPRFHMLPIRVIPIARSRSGPVHKSWIHSGTGTGLHLLTRICAGTYRSPWRFTAVPVSALYSRFETWTNHYFCELSLAPIPIYRSGSATVHTCIYRNLVQYWCQPFICISELGLFIVVVRTPAPMPIYGSGSAPVHTGIFGYLVSFSKIVKIYSVGFLPHLGLILETSKFFVHKNS